MQSIRFAQITATNCKLTKSFHKEESGFITSSAIAHMTEGRATVVEITGLSSLSTVFHLLQPNQAITCGVPVIGDTPLTTRAGAELRRDAVARTNEAFDFPFDAALFPIDVDVDGDSYTSVTSVLDALEACSPWLKHVHRVARPSSSSYVAGRGLRGVHAYFVVTRGTDTPALAKRMQMEQWAAGRGYVKISKSGALLVRQLADALVYQPSRLMFEAQPECHEGVERVVPRDQLFVDRPAQIIGAPAKYRTADGWLDVQALPPVKAIEERRFEAAVRQAKNARRREAKKIAIDYQKANAIANGYDAEQGERYGLLATRALGDKALPASWVVAVKDVGRQTVEQIVAALPDSLGFQCADPFDTWRPDLDAKSYTKAEIVMMGDTPGIWSHKLQEFFAFSSDRAADLASPLDLAAEKLCGLVEFPEPAGKKAAPFVNVMHGLRLLFAEIGSAPRLNVCTGMTETDDLPSVGRLCDALSRIGCSNVTPGSVERAIEALADAQQVDPWKDVILNLPQWDGIARLDTVFSDVFGPVSTDALQRVSQMLFSALVMRQLRPGAPAGPAPILIGPQGCGKSQFVAGIARALGLPAPSSIAFSDDRRMSMAAARSPVAELAEMSGLGRRDAEDVKRWMSDDIDVYRRPYERQEESHPRRFVTVGTANKYEINRDETGNRRMMPVLVEHAADPNWTVEVPQICAEAKARFCDDESAYFALVREATDAVRAYNAEAMRRGEGTPTMDLDDLLPPILDNHIRSTGEPRVPSTKIRMALDAIASGRRVTAKEIASWLTMRGWTIKRTATARYYEAPQDYIDNSAKSNVVSLVNPFNPPQGAFA
jgi:hypothetical protein